MRAVDIIIKKRDRQELSEGEIRYFVEGFTRGDIPDYQAAAWAMAVLLNGMTTQETTYLTLAMAQSGKILDLSSAVRLAVDKHSTGGVGDKTTLVVEPVVAACGLPVGKMSGRGLGFSGGTLDKLESIPGCRVNLSMDEFLDQLKNEGLVLIGQNDDLAPADGKFYALRDVTGTVQSIPLIASSIMSKKLAAGAQAILLDVKVGLGAFMQTLEEARQLARLMVDIASLANRKATALISDMHQPLGQAVGNSLEVCEAIETLHGGGPDDFREHCLMVSAHLLILGEFARDENHGLELARRALDGGKAWEKFRALVRAQGGDLTVIDNPNLLPKAQFVEEVFSPGSGWLSQVNAKEVGETSVLLGAGRAKKGDPIDHSVGIIVHHKVGEKVSTGTPLFSIHANRKDLLPAAKEKLLSGVKVSPEPVEPLPLFYDVIR
ncbi:MAG: thymidine phosphorylase [Chloroflexi bacterium]|nr:MAG: thymidine phosphorylase [Chloroflexota bacterium]